MKIEGGCYCGNLRYEAEGEPVFKGLCHCRECQYIAGGNANAAIAMPADGFRFTRGEARIHRRTDLEKPASRLFCPECGTHILSKNPIVSGVVIIKVGTLDNPALFDKPDTAIWMSEAQAFHHVPEGVPTFPGFVPRD
ncbi:MAG: GFA family protein [Pseudomonadales bacterium]|nr:GFA family protein [Pseudomonadales bacterium]